MLKVADIESIRHLYFGKGWSIRGIGRGLHHSRKTVRKALRDPGPWEYRRSRPRPAPKVGPYRELIRQWLLGNQKASRKQRHTARRIYQRLGDDHSYQGTESTIRRAVAQLGRDLEMAVVEPFLSSPPTPARWRRWTGARPG